MHFGFWKGIRRISNWKSQIQKLGLSDPAVSKFPALPTHEALQKPAKVDATNRRCN